MKTKTKTVCKSNTLYRLTYILEDFISGFHLLIRSEEFDRESFRLKKGTPPRFSEESCTTLTDFSRDDAEKLFYELSENLVFPCSLKYILEDNF